MKRSIFALILILIISPLAGEEADSLHSETITDSISNAGIDQIDVNSPALKYNPVKLKSAIDKYIENHHDQISSEWLPCWTYKSNKHYITLKDGGLNVRKMGFSIRPWARQQIRDIQSNRAFYLLSSRGHNINLENYYYDNTVTIVSAEAGLGDYENMHGNFTLRKGKLFGSDNTGLNLSVSGINGYWFGAYDSASNMRLHLFHKLKLGQLEYIHTSISEEMSSNLTYYSEKEIEKLTSQEEIFYFSNSYLDLGIRYETGNLAAKKRNLLGLMARKIFNYGGNDFDFSYEFLQQTGDAEKHWQIFGGEASGSLSRLFYEAGFSFTNSDNYYTEAHIFGDIFKGLGISSKFYEWTYQDSLIYNNLAGVKRKGFGISCRKEKIKFDVHYGVEDNDIDNDWYLESNLEGKKITGNIELKLRNWSFYFLNPDLQIQTEAEIIYNLPYYNWVRFCLKNYFYSDHINNEGIFVEQAYSIDLLLGMRVSRQFEIRAEMINITNNMTFLGYSHTGLHYLFNIFWHFIN
jgi:hypothetical protein